MSDTTENTPANDTERTDESAGVDGNESGTDHGNVNTNLSPNADRFRKQAIASELREPVTEARNLAEKLGLEPYPVNYWIIDYDEMNELIAYGGFQSRYPHWRWGMQYDRQQKQGQYGGGKAFEIVNNDNPAHAFLQESNALADQKAVITHVEAHSDFFANNEWFGLFTNGRADQTQVNAAAMLERHARAIDEYMSDPEIDRADVEKWIDHCLSLEDNIDQHRVFERRYDVDGPNGEIDDDLAQKVGELDLSEEIKGEVFDEEWLEKLEETDRAATFPEHPQKDVLAFVREHGKQYDEETDRAVEMTEWQRDVLDMMRAEGYYFAAQKMTKVMNEGWAAYWESTMMTDEGFAGDDEFLNYADHMAKVLASGGLNPYSLGMELWEYVENTTNRREVIERILRVEGITWHNFADVVDVDDVLESLEPPDAIDEIASETLESLAEVPSEWVDHDALEAARAGEIDVERYPWKVLRYEGLARRHYSLVKRQHRGFLSRITQNELERIGRYLFDDARYASVDEALADVEFTAGWDRMYDVRESHNDVTFLDEFLTREFITENDYFTYEHSRATGQFHVASDATSDVKKKLLLQFTNFGKPTIAVYDGNYNNANELLLGHQYNGVVLDIGQARETLKRTFELWGRPVNLLTIVKEIDEHDVEVAKRRNREPEAEERGKLIRYDGESVTTEDVPWEDVEHLAAEDVDYDTKPDEWLA
ncbi:AbrB family transcriptional regulator [Natrarchaeobius halalkaliphilus]|uniref:AbrB family transcriptional regulator n=1 Tax=Natrarchaeobius halalkaliphilus TaxID=1679091 RepID=A0A3N6LQ71_9EURY|nr:SpoVR family protein [Natrarchaeobius halalkaliphilus]RQG91713.1 AbrB family transcriptional regulator [Natrarchaeobius halalkaliphilus]